jgi:replication factor C subunit 2/4
MSAKTAADAERKVEEHGVVCCYLNLIFYILYTNALYMSTNASFDIPFIAKYQPSKIHEFEQLDENTITIIHSLIMMDNLNIMFYGDSGSGKTSIINAIIREYYNKCASTTVIQENILILNSLKEQGIQYYRNDVKVFCQTMSMIPNRKKIVLLDDIDLINEQGQQVFRNCIDKYSHNVHFISSCTNIQKVVDTFQSRNIIIKINQLNQGCLNKIMLKIKVNEGLSITTDAEGFLLQVSNGSVRTLINYLEKIKLIDREITFDLANKICTNISFHRFEEYTREILRCGGGGGGGRTDPDSCLRAANAILFQLNDEGYSVLDILDNYFLFVKLTPLFDEDTKYRITSLVCKYITIFHNIHEHDIELALFTNNLLGLRLGLRPHTTPCDNLC